MPEDLFTTGDYSFTHIFWELQTGEASLETFRRGVAGEHVATTFVRGAVGCEDEFFAWTANATADSFGNGLKTFGNFVLLVKSGFKLFVVLIILKFGQFVLRDSYVFKEDLFFSDFPTDV